MAKTRQREKNTKRLDGKKKLVALTSQMESDLLSYCREKGIENESELIRQAIVKYIYNEYEDETLKLSGLKDIRENIRELRDMVQVLFSYTHHMHLNLLAYHPEIAEELKDSGFSSAKNRHEKFYASFRERLRNDPPFFERLLHTYVTGTLD